MYVELSCEKFDARSFDNIFITTPSGLAVLTVVKYVSDVARL